MQKVIKNKRNVIKGEINRASSDKSCASHSSVSLGKPHCLVGERDRERERYNYKVVRKNKKRMLYIYVLQNLNAFFNSEKEKETQRKPRKQGNY